MKNLISSTISRISSLLKGLQVKSFLAVVIVGLILLTTNVSLGNTNKTLTERVRQDIQQNDSDRPKTTGQWNKEARQTEGAPGERLKRIGKESAEAFKEFGSGYVEGAKETAGDVQEGAATAGRGGYN